MKFEGSILCWSVLLLTIREGIVKERHFLCDSNYKRREWQIDDGVQGRAC